MSTVAARGVNLAVIGDVHLEAEDPCLAPFLSLLRSLGDSACQVVLMGDLFNLWLGRRELEQPHQTLVLGELAELRRRGVRVCYIEGNRDYRIGPAYAESALDEATSEAIVLRFGGRRVVAIHGDLANTRDLAYRSWRRLSRAAPVWALFNLLPRARRRRMAEGLELRLRTTNQAFKREVSDDLLRGYAASLSEGPSDLVLLGHFHVERDLVVDPAARHGRVIVLPEWKGTRRHLVLTPEGGVAFESAPG